MDDQQLHALSKARKERADYYCSLVPNHNIKVGDTLYLTTLQDITPRKVVYRKDPERNSYQLFGDSCIFHSTEDYITSTHDMMCHLAGENFYSAIDVICVSYEQAAQVRHRLIDDQVRYITQVPTVTKLLQYMNQHPNRALRIQQAILQKLNEFDEHDDKTIRLMTALLNRRK